MKLLNQAAAVVLLLLGAAGEIKAEQILTGLVEFSTDASGNFSGGQVWNTAGSDGAFNLWLVGGANQQGAFLNGPADAQASVSVPLSNGTHTFHVFGEPGLDLGTFGLNLFFDGNTSTPRISVLARTDETGTPPPFSANRGNTLAVHLQPTPGAGKVAFTDQGTTVTLTTYDWTAPSVYGLDRVSPFTATPNGHADFFGSFTLDVESNGTIANGPEPSGLILLGIGAAGVGAFAYYRRRTPFR
jgi:hypothetical protein